MFKGLKSFISVVKLVIRYGSLAIVILAILGYAANELEKWAKDNEPKEEVK